MYIVKHIKEKFICRKIKYNYYKNVFLSVRVQPNSYLENSVISAFFGGIPRAGTTFVNQLIVIIYQCSTRINSNMFLMHG